MTEALNTLAADKDMPEVQPVFITIDPDRDTPEKLQAYLQDFHPKLLGLTGTNAEVKAAVSIFSIIICFFLVSKNWKSFEWFIHVRNLLPLFFLPLPFNAQFTQSTGKSVSSVLQQAN